MTTGTTTAMRRWAMAICAGLLAFSAMTQAADLPARPKPGDVPPDMLGKDTDGVLRTVSGHRGKVLIVTFWASWCGPCRKELPVLAKVQAAVGREHLEVVAVNFKEDRRTFNEVRKLNRDFDLTYVHDAKGTTSDSYGVNSLPNMFIIDADGRVAHVHHGYSEAVFQKFIEEMLALLPPDALAKPAGKG